MWEPLPAIASPIEAWPGKKTEPALRLAGGLEIPYFCAASVFDLREGWLYRVPS